MPASLQRPNRRFYSGILTLVGLLCWTGLAVGQSEMPGSALPRPRLTAVNPPGGKAGTTVDVTIVGTDLEEPESLRFSHPGITATPIVPPAPAPDPKKPNAPPPPKPAVTSFKVTIAPDVPPCVVDVRLINRWGVSNARAFQVGEFVEVLEKEPNNDVVEAQRVELNTTVNGLINAPTDVDYTIFTGKKGQQVVISCLTSTIDSRLVPMLELYDVRGRRLASNRNDRRNDARVTATLPADGDYLVRLTQFAHVQGGNDNFYRLRVSTAPWIDVVFPPMVEPGKSARVTLTGVNLPGGQPLPPARGSTRIIEKLETEAAAPADVLTVRNAGCIPATAANLDGFDFTIRGPAGVTDPYRLQFATAPVVLENEANDAADRAQELPVPCEIAGRIEKRQDRDWYAFQARKGDVLMIEVVGDRVDVPVDPYFILRNATNNQVITEQDDDPDPVSLKFYSRTTDPAPYQFTVPADGKYLLMVADRQGDAVGGPRFVYRLRVGPRRPDFRLVVLSGDYHRPEAACVRAGGCEDFTVIAYRNDGWTGDIELSMEGLPAGVTCPPQVLGAGSRQATLVVHAAPNAATWTGTVKVKGTARIEGKPVVREARPAAITLPVQPGSNLPVLSRLERELWLAVREKAMYGLTASIDKPFLQQGDKATVQLKLERIAAEAKVPVQVQSYRADLPPNNAVQINNNNQPVTINPDKADGTMPVQIAANAPPGVYTFALRAQATIPFNKDPMAKQKPNTVVVQPSLPFQVTILPKTVATLTLNNGNPSVKVGTSFELVVTLNRQNNYAGPLTVEVVLPPNTQGIEVAKITIPEGQNEGKLTLKVAPNANPGGRSNLIVRGTAALPGNLQAIQETKFNVNVTK